MISVDKHAAPRVLMLLYSLPPVPMGGAELQGMKLAAALQAAGTTVLPLTWGKLWHPRSGVFNGIPFVRIRSVLNIITDIPSLIKRNRKPASVPTRILYDDSREITNQMTGRVGLAMILRYRLFYLNCLIYLWRKRKQFDIIHVHTIEWPAFVAVRLGNRLNKPVVIKDSTMNGITNILRYPNGGHKQQEIAAYGNFVAMTRMIHTSFLKAGVPSERITDIPNGIEITPLPSKASPWKQRFIFVGNLRQQPAKGIDILLLAWKALIKQYPEARLDIVGEGDLTAYQEFARNMGLSESVHFLGKRQDIRQLLLQSDVFVLPSRREGMSNALMEAMICGLPVVATDVSGSQDLVEDGVSGLLVPVANVEALTSAMIRMLEDPTRSIEMGRRGYESVKEKCDINKVTSRYIQLYQQILSSRS